VRQFQIFKNIVKGIQMKALKGEEVVYTSMTEHEALIDLTAVLNKINYAKIFEVDEDLMYLLTLTDNKVRPVRLPYPITFVETKFKLPDVWVRTDQGEELLKEQRYHGLLLIEAEPMSDFPLHIEVEEKDVVVTRTYPNIFIYSVTEDHRGFGHIKISLYKDYEARGQELSHPWLSERQMLRTIVMNFLDFLQNPEVEVVEVQRAPSTREEWAQKKRGLLLPKNVVRVTGVLKRYVKKLKRGRKFTYSHRFWVRGHWRHLTSPVFKYKRGLKVWIPPFVKGSGLLIDKTYKLIDRRRYTQEYYEGMLKGSN